MDAHHFDALARALTTTRSRRGVARLLGALSFTSILAARGSEEASAARRLGGQRCARKTACKSGTCLNPDRCDCTKQTCKCTCSCSRTNPKVRCEQPGNACKKAVCTEAGRCVIENRTDGATCGASKICQNGLCARTCTTDPECGTECMCRPPDGGASSVCVKNSGTISSCPGTPCPSGQMCINNVGIRGCFEPCGAP